MGVVKAYFARIQVRNLTVHQVMIPSLDILFKV
jgi:hypothetical protein